ncbi:MAG TPA: ferritin-like domain-containing protein, partial [Actinomycetota bacterium]|nr:ferritin-like domain-containing protein [Actinomycetota bacterium]
GIDERHLRAIDRWREIVLEVAREEMLHLAQVNNLLAAIGSAPRVARPNLPASGRHFPPAVQFALVPFGERALRHFLYLERPEGITLRDADGFEVQEEAEPLMSEEDIVPRPQDFATVGHLYRSIEEGFRHLAAKHGERWLFIGPPRAQARPETFRWPHLVPVTDLASALAAIDIIVEQGEGPRGHWADAHYGRFLEVLGEYLEFRKHDPTFEPARPVMAACVRPPVDGTKAPLVTDPTTARVLDSFNVAYEIVLYLLARYFGHGSESDAELETLADVAVMMMIDVIAPLGELITTLPAGEEYPGMNAGPSFELFYGSGYLLPHRRSAWILLHERLIELETFVRGVTTELSPHEATLETIADRVRTHSEALAATMPELASRTFEVG